MSARELAIGVDVGGTKIAAALVNGDGEVLAQVRRPTAVSSGNAAILDNIAASIQELLDQAPAPVRGIGVGSPGQVDPVHGVVRHALNLGWDGEAVALRAGLQARLATPLPLYVQRDSYAELLGEAYFGAGMGCQHLVYLGLGTGLGGAALSHGQLISGANDFASEIGHLVLEPHGRVWHGNLRGTAESLLSGSGVLVQTQAWLAEGRYPSRLQDTPQLTAEEVVTAAYEGDELATAVFAQASAWLTRVLALYATILNPERIIIGGGLGRAAFDLLVPSAPTQLPLWVLPPASEKLRVVRSQVVNTAVGASCLVWHYQPPPNSKEVSTNLTQAHNG
jgi:glucokinase